MRTTQKKAGKGAAIGVGVILVSIAVAWWQKEVGMQRGFDAIQRSYESSQPTLNPQTISGPIDHALYAIVGGIVGVLIGLMIIVRSLVVARRR